MNKLEYLNLKSIRYSITTSLIDPPDFILSSSGIFTMHICISYNYIFNPKSGKTNNDWNTTAFLYTVLHYVDIFTEIEQTGIIVFYIGFNVHN